VVEQILTTEGARQAAVANGDTADAAAAASELGGLWDQFERYQYVPQGVVRPSEVEELRATLRAAQPGQFIDLTNTYSREEATQLAPFIYEAQERGARVALPGDYAWDNWQALSANRQYTQRQINMPVALANLGLTTAFTAAGLFANGVIQSDFNQTLADRGNAAAETRTATQRENSERLAELSRQHRLDLASRNRGVDQERFAAQQQLNDQLFGAQQELNQQTAETGQANSQNRFDEASGLADAQEDARDRIGANDGTYDSSQGINLDGQPVLPGGTIVPVSDQAGRPLTLEESVVRLRATNSPEVRGYSAEQLAEFAGAARRSRGIPDDPPAGATTPPVGAPRDDDQSALPDRSQTADIASGIPTGETVQDPAAAAGIDPEASALPLAMVGINLFGGQGERRVRGTPTGTVTVVGDSPGEDPIELASQVGQVMTLRSTAQERGEPVVQLDAELRDLERRLSLVSPTSPAARPDVVQQAVGTLNGAGPGDRVDLRLRANELYSVAPEIAAAQTRTDGQISVEVNIPSGPGAGPVEARNLSRTLRMGEYRDRFLLGCSVALGVVGGCGGLALGELARQQATGTFDQGQQTADTLAAQGWDQDLARFYKDWTTDEAQYGLTQSIGDANSQLAQRRQVDNFNLSRNQTLNNTAAAERLAAQQQQLNLQDDVAEFQQELGGVSADRAGRFGAEPGLVVIDGVRYAVPIFAETGRAGITDPNLDAAPGQVNPEAIKAFVNSNSDLPVIQGIRERLYQQYPGLAPVQVEQRIREQVSAEYGPQIQQTINDEWARRRGTETDPAMLPEQPASSPPGNVGPVTPAPSRELQLPRPSSSQPSTPAPAQPPPAVPVPPMAAPPALDRVAPPGSTPVGEPQSSLPQGQGDIAGSTTDPLSGIGPIALGGIVAGANSVAGLLNRRSTQSSGEEEVPGGGQPRVEARPPDDVVGDRDAAPGEGRAPIPEPRVSGGGVTVGVEPEFLEPPARQIYTFPGTSDELPEMESFPSGESRGQQIYTFPGTSVELPEMESFPSGESRGQQIYTFPLPPEDVVEEPSAERLPVSPARSAAAGDAQVATLPEPALTPDPVAIQPGATRRGSDGQLQTLVGSQVLVGDGAAGTTSGQVSFFRSEDGRIEAVVQSPRRDNGDRTETVWIPNVGPTLATNPKGAVTSVQEASAARLTTGTSTQAVQIRTGTQTQPLAGTGPGSEPGSVTYQAVPENPRLQDVVVEPSATEVVNTDGSRTITYSALVPENRQLSSSGAAERFRVAVGTPMRQVQQTRFVPTLAPTLPVTAGVASPALTGNPPVVDPSSTYVAPTPGPGGRGEPRTTQPSGGQGRLNQAGQWVQDRVQEAGQAWNDSPVTIQRTGDGWQGFNPTGYTVRFGDGRVGNYDTDGNLVGGDGPGTVPKWQLESSPPAGLLPYLIPGRGGVGAPAGGQVMPSFRPGGPGGNVQAPLP